MARKTRNQRKQERLQPENVSSWQGRFKRHRPVLDRLLLVLALLGVMTTVHLWIQEGRGFDQGCWGFNPPSAEAQQTFNCEAVLQSDAGRIFGVSNVVVGFLFYMLLAGLSGLALVGGEGRRAQVRAARAVLIGIGFLYSIYLVLYQINGIGEYCALCLTSAGIATTLFIVQIADLVTVPESGSLAPSLASTRFLRAAVGVVVVLLVADLVYFNNLAPAEGGATAVAEIAEGDRVPVGTPADQTSGPAECHYDSRYSPFPDYETLIPDDTPYKGAADAPVTVIEFFDPNCPHCRDLYPVIEQFIEEHGDKARFYYVPFPIAQQSLPQIEAMLVANEDGKYYEMIGAQMSIEAVRGLSLGELRVMARQIGIDPNKLENRLQVGAYRGMVRSHYETVRKAGVTSVPSVLVNDRFIGTKSPECLLEFIQDAAS